MLSTADTDILFRQARTHSSWLDKPVTDAQIAALYEQAKWGATAANCSPARIVFVKSPAAKEKLLSCMNPGNRAKTGMAPLSAIIGMDMRFYDQLPHLCPHTDARAWFVGNDEKIAATALRNSSLQGAYLMLAARALGLDAGPMSGFDSAAVEASFFAGTDVKVNFICNFGYGDHTALSPRAPRLTFDEACRIA